jgi:Spy/CpxP family protein refolding chaperone
MRKFATLLLLSAVLAFAQAPAKKVQHRAMKALNLSAAQKQQAKSIFHQTKQNLQPLRQQLKQNHEAMRAAIQANNTAEIQRLAGLQGNLQSQVISNRAQAMAKFYATLTPEQAAQMGKMQDRKKSFRKKG